MVGAEKRAQMSNFRQGLDGSLPPVRKDWRGEVAGVDASGKKTPPYRRNTAGRLNPTAYQYLDRYLILYNEFKYNILY